MKIQEYQTTVKLGRGPRLEAGMTLAIEPMIIAGKPDICELDDGWTIVTEDRKFISTLWKYNFSNRKWTKSIDNTLKIRYNTLVNYRISSFIIYTDCFAIESTKAT